MLNNTIEAFYKSLEVIGRGRHCPRPGIYKILSTFNATAYNKPALLAKCQWRTTTTNEYQDSFTVTIQMESFKLNATQAQLAVLTGNELMGKEINVNVARVSNGQFIIKWDFLKTTYSIDELNQRLKRNELNDFEFDEVNQDEIEEDHEPLD